MFYFVIRYHFAGSKSIFYAREPYLNDKAMHVTRFVGLSAVGNKEKQVLFSLWHSLIFSLERRRIFFRWTPTLLAVMLSSLFHNFIYRCILSPLGDLF